MPPEPSPASAILFALELLHVDADPRGGFKIRHLLTDCSAALITPKILPFQYRDEMLAAPHL